MAAWTSPLCAARCCIPARTALKSPSSVAIPPGLMTRSIPSNIRAVLRTRLRVNSGASGSIPRAAETGTQRWRSPARASRPRRRHAAQIVRLRLSRLRVEHGSGWQNHPLPGRLFPSRGAAVRPQPLTRPLPRPALPAEGQLTTAIRPVVTSPGPAAVGLSPRAAL
jgi:hypothetical protein